MKRFSKTNLFRLLCLSAILVLALAACGPNTGANPGVLGTPGLLNTPAVGSATGSSGLTDLTSTPSVGTGSSTSTSTAGSSTDLTATPLVGTDTTSTASAGGSTDLAGTPTPGTDSTNQAGTPSANTTVVVPVTGGPATVNIADDPTLGKILVDGNGMTLYTYAKDTTGVSNCSGGCLQNWPPLLTNGTPVAGAGVDATQLGTINAPSSSTMDSSTPAAGAGSMDTSTPSAGTGTTGSSSGAMLVTYKGMPLYTYIQDTKPGDVNGKNVGGVWAVAVP